MLCRGVYDVLIHLICHHKGVILDGQLCNGLQFIPAEHFATGIGGVAEDEGLGTPGKALFNKAQVEFIIRRHQRDINGFCP